MASPAELEELLHVLATERKLDLRGYKRTTLERRIARRLSILRIRDYPSYIERVRSDPAEINHLLDTILINVTRFFRDPPVWHLLQKEVMPTLLGGEEPVKFRVWCAGCATGEEAYSVAILVADYFGDRLAHQDIKIYATDQDEGALQIARHATYPEESLSGIKASWREYFEGRERVRVARSVRRLVIFGRSDLLTNAPISHVRLLVCRNVLIYFGAEAQQHILSRFEYALDPGGVLVLGKTESQLRGNPAFAPLSAKWRIFQRTQPGGKEVPRSLDDKQREEQERALHELERLRAYHASLLETLHPGVVVLDNSGSIVTANEAVKTLLGISPKSLLGEKLEQSELASRCPELPQRVQESRSGNGKKVQFEQVISREKALAITVKPIHGNDDQGRVGTLIHVEDVSSRDALQHTVEELETTTEELQSANEELETTNEELQSTNEELETTNEELQSSNEELETTNEELQSLNEELETTNEELAERTRQLDVLNERHNEMLEQMPWPVLLVNRDHRIYLYNSAARRVFGFAPPSSAGMAMNELPIHDSLSRLLVRSYGTVSTTRKPQVLRRRILKTNRVNSLVDIHISPLSKASAEEGVLLMFNALPEDQGNHQSASKKAAGRSKPKKSTHKTARRKRK